MYVCLHVYLYVCMQIYLSILLKLVFLLIFFLLFAYRLKRLPHLHHSFPLFTFTLSFLHCLNHNSSQHHFSLFLFLLLLPPLLFFFVSIKTNTPTSLDSLYFPSPWVLLLAPFLSSAGILYEFFTDWEGLESDHFAGKFARCIYMPQVLRNLCVQHIIIRLIKYTHILRLTGIIKKKMIAFVRVKRSFWFLCESKQKQ